MLLCEEFLIRGVVCVTVKMQKFGTLNISTEIILNME